MNRALFSASILVFLQMLAPGQTSEVQVRIGAINPRVACSSNPAESYALYLPSGFSTNRQWPILYLFDPFARGQAAAEVVQPAAEKFGYIVAASNNSKNGPKGGSKDAAIAMWEDTQLRLPVDSRRRYAAGLSGGAAPPRHMSFAFFGAVGNADFNYAEFVSLRRELDKANARYRISIFEGTHGWAPAQIWSQLVVQAYDSGQVCMEKKDFDSALACFRLAEAGSSSPGFAHFQRARVYAMKLQKGNAVRTAPGFVRRLS